MLCDMLSWFQRALKKKIKTLSYLSKHEVHFFFFLLKRLRRTFNTTIVLGFCLQNVGSQGQRKLGFAKPSQMSFVVIADEIIKTPLFPLGVKCLFSLAMVWGAKS